MAIDFAQAPEIEALTDRTREFVDTVVIPLEEEHRGDAASGGEQLRVRLQDAAREAGVFAPHVEPEYGGLGLGLCARAPVFEAAGRSVFGPPALNAAAPDEGNTHLLAVMATPEQRERYLRPLATGAVRSSFAMTEPAPGAGSDPAALRTTARKVPGGWRIDGRKWFITGADGAAFVITMARTGDTATIFLVDSDNPGLTVERHIDTIDHGFFGGHCELTYRDCFVPDTAVLGLPGEGFAHAQVRLGPARMTHCLRWLGLARRAADLAADHAAQRELFGSKLADLGQAQAMIADSEIDIAAARALVLHACWELDSGARAAQSTAIAKTFTAEAVGRVVDRAVQICGARGISADLPLGRFLNEVRPFRIYDGPSEALRWAIARHVIRLRS